MYRWGLWCNQSGQIFLVVPIQGNHASLHRFLFSVFFFSALTVFFSFFFPGAVVYMRPPVW